MTVTSALTPISPAMVLAKVDEALSMDYSDGVIGLRGIASDAVRTDLQHQGRTVRVRPAESALAAREALAEHRDGEWMVVVTDRDDDDLGAGILAHFVWHRVRNPDPWEAVRHRFAATGIDPLLTTRPDSTDLATDLVAATPVEGWPASPAGVLTRAHALGSVAAAHLGYDGDAGDPLGVLRWTMGSDHVSAVAALRHGVGDRLTDATLEWIAERAGPAARPVASLLARGELADVVPLGVVLHLLTSVGSEDAATRHQAQLALVRLEPRWGDPRPSEQSLAALGRACDALIADLVHDRRADSDVDRVLRRGDEILAQIHATPLARGSDLLASGMRARLVVLADALRRAVHDPRAVQDPRAVDTAPVEVAWRQLAAHRLAAPGARPSADVRPFAAAVRLVRWLARPEPELPAAAPARLAALATRHLSDDAWADAALDDAFAGVDDPELSPALQAVVTRSLARRTEQERRFARALAPAGTSPGTRDVLPGEPPVWFLERLLTGAVIPLATRVPVLLLVMDGMSVTTATEILDDATTRLGWTEAALNGSSHRGGALAVLPTLTEVSRTSLLCGRLTEGQQPAERAGYTEITSQTGKIRAALFHKKGVDTTAAGWSISHDVGQALDDGDVRLVTVVLNTVDDALDRSDPAGTVWTADAVKHLEPLLARAAAAGRVVVMTADHGHVVERRLGTQVPHQDSSSGRSRGTNAPAGDGEIEVSGPRVLAPGQRAVLAVDATLRYGPLKAGYHGGASAAEVVVPVAVLVRESESTALPAGLSALPPQQPAWWDDASPIVDAPAATVPEHRATAAGATLFDLPTAETPAAVPGSLGRAVVRSAVYRRQRKLASRLIITDDQVARLVDALAAAPATRLAATPAAQALGVPQTRLSGALTQVQQLLNVEGYPVLARDTATGVAVLDLVLLGEQFEVLA